jgi:SAM-dependent methyltransferase
VNAGVPGPVTRSLFDSVADSYDHGRPGYPAELFDTLESLIARSLAGATVLDVGPGTGISMRLLASRGARVVGVELGPAMAARLRARDPSAAVAIGDGNILPVRSASVDLVTYAQAWHWLDPRRSLDEAVRVLRPGGSIAAWWNRPDTSEPWIDEQFERIAAACPEFHRYSIPPMSESLETVGVSPFLAEVRWTWRVPLETFLTGVHSWSYVARLGRAGADAVVERERAVLSRLFADGMVVRPHLVHLAVGRL